MLRYRIGASRPNLFLAITLLFMFCSWDWSKSLVLRVSRRQEFYAGNKGYRCGGYGEKALPTGVAWIDPIGFTSLNLIDQSITRIRYAKNVAPKTPAKLFAARSNENWEVSRDIYLSSPCYCKPFPLPESIYRSAYLLLCCHINLFLLKPDSILERKVSSFQHLLGDREESILLAFHISNERFPQQTARPRTSYR